MSGWVGAAAVAGWAVGHFLPPGPSFWIVAGVVAVYLVAALRRVDRF